MEYVYVRDDVAVFPRFGLVVLWLVGLTTAGLSTMLVLQMAGRLPVRGWEQAVSYTNLALVTLLLTGRRSRQLSEFFHFSRRILPVRVSGNFSSE